ncbi:MAG: hypothetical protein COU07_03850 [Candidatus Harrisonbacteria bacterium CG10_big_fil_rev_8_21_14_0_10_40_38]|uniref:TIGR00725 family protein n=1 Tax=Candidatus Harrisonbacteria bacterium CG10_big_fil_rev_8_21_14_0_10_40_38 TaxID=1974583 RepID=A0A2H0UTL7_9BACT|nr:MAG: hypothetical protein COU07_03850 [Candidatus Harrisonbacteria bacterium CG10_big_fil_rev_8_21_14_0_10_40_38]
MQKLKKLSRQKEELVRPYCLRCKIGVSGAAETGHCAIDAVEKAEAVGREIARAGLVLVTGATTGMPYWSAKGAKEEGGMVIGLSPASSEAAHVKTYHLPVDYHDVIVYTGFEYSGRNLLLTRSVDAVVVICGRIGTLNEFTIAYEDHKPIGILEGSGGTADMIREIVETSKRGPGKIVYSSDPKELIKKLTELIEHEKEKYIS